MRRLKKGKEVERKKGRPKDSGRVVRLEKASEIKLISETKVKFSGTTAAKIEQGVFRATARRDSKPTITSRHTDRVISHYYPREGTG